jgi:hypothetical protein
MNACACALPESGATLPKGAAANGGTQHLCRLAIRVTRHATTADTNEVARSRSEVGDHRRDLGGARCRHPTRDNGLGTSVVLNRRARQHRVWDRAGSCGNAAAGNVLPAPPPWGHVLLLSPVNCQSPSGALAVGRRASGVPGSAFCGPKSTTSVPPFPAEPCEVDHAPRWARRCGLG